MHLSIRAAPSPRRGRQLASRCTLSASQLFAHALSRRPQFRGICTAAYTANLHNRNETKCHSRDLDLPQPSSDLTEILIPSPSHLASSPRKRSIQNARPFSDFLTDNFHRQHNYLRISLTERCNLRCVYCMPEEGVPLSPPRSLLTTPEITLLASTFVSQGVSKIRLTGGEPTVRPDILPLMQQLGALRPHGLRELCLTTNGLALHRKLDAMVDAGLTGINLSLDTLDPWQYQIMTRRRGFDAVQRSITRIHELNRAGANVKFKINCVVMRGVNDRELLDFVDLTRASDVEVRFIEYMPFDGNKWNKGKMFSYAEMLNVIRARYPSLQKVQDHKNDTSKTWHVPGFSGRIGFVTSMTHNFCGSCNRLRITSDGNLKVCLFGNAEVSLRDVLREANGGEPIDNEALARFRKAAIDEQLPAIPPTEAAEKHLMLASNSEKLLSVIGAAVKRKKAKHAGMGELEHMKNRPMILIDWMPSYTPNTKLGILETGFMSSTLTQRIKPSILQAFPLHIPTPNNLLAPSSYARLFSTTATMLSRSRDKEDDEVDALASNSINPKLTHLTPTGEAHMVPISHKSPTHRTARAVCSVVFTHPRALDLMRAQGHKKGDVLAVARVAGIMAAKRTPDLIPLCHPVMLSHVAVDLAPQQGGGGGGGASSSNSSSIDVRATVTCDGKTGVEMEALTAAAAAALTVYDMCKAVDRGMRVEGLRVVLKEGGKSGRWVEGGKEEGEG